MAVPIELDRPRNLKLNLASLGELEDKHGKPLADVYLDILKRGVNATVASLWAALKHEDPTMTFPLARKLLQAYLDDGKDIQIVTDALSKAFREVGVFNKDFDEGNAQPEQVASS